MIYSLQSNASQGFHLHRTTSERRDSTLPISVNTYVVSYLRVVLSKFTEDSNDFYLGELLFWCQIKMLSESIG